MLVETVSHFVEADANVFFAYLLANHELRHGRKLVMKESHNAGQNRGVAHSRVKQAQRGRHGLYVFGGHAHPFGYNLLLVAGIHEKQVFLSIVKESEGAVRSGIVGHGRDSFKKFIGIEQTSSRAFNATELQKSKCSAS
jgi:hypothetical protein